MKTTKKGFTLIEVILVLAIAALIILMVLLTLPAVQRAQRDTARKEDVGKVISAYTEFLSNNRGSRPSVSATVCLGSSQKADATNKCDLNPYITLTDGQTYSYQGEMAANATVTGSQTAAAGTNKATQDNIAIWSNARCGATDGQTGSDGGIRTGTSSRQVVAIVKLEGNGGANTMIYYCQEG